MSTNEEMNETENSSSFNQGVGLGNRVSSNTMNILFIYFIVKQNKKIAASLFREDML